MDATLFINPILQIDSRTQTAESILFNRARVIDWGDNSDDETIFYYKVSESGRERAIPFKSQYPILQFETIFNETTTNKFIVVNVNRINMNCKTWKDTGGLAADSNRTKRRINLQNVVIARTFGSYQYLWVDRGNNTYMLIETADTLAEINGTASNSGSIN